MPQLSAQIEKRLNVLIQTFPLAADTASTDEQKMRALWHAWGISAATIIVSVVPDLAHPYRLGLIALNAQLNTSPREAASRLYAMLFQLRHDFAAGLLTNLESQISAQTFDDLLDHAEAYLGERRRDPAGVLTGVVFEDTIHKLCARHDIPHEGVSLEPLLSALASKKIITPLERKECTTAAGLRTSATHARWAEFDDDQVKTVLAFTRRLLRGKLDA